MDIFNWDVAHVFSFLLTFLRISLVLFMMPFFGGESLPHSVKAAFCLVVSLALWPHMSFPGVQMPAHPLQIVLMLVGELILGLVLSLAVHFVFAAVQTGGQIIGFQMGFVMVSVVDPLTGISEAVTAHFLYMVSLLVFLSLDGHLFLFQALGKSFALVPPGGLLITKALCDNVLGLSTKMFVLAVKIAAPVMAVMFLVELALALISRAAPQMHILMIGFPLRIGVGFFFLGLIFSLIATYMGNFIADLGGLFYNIAASAG
jgi:flagellar biosynthetic protein FliR